MQSTFWSETLQKAADPARARDFFDQMTRLSRSAADLLQAATPEQARLWAVLWSGSTELSELLLAHPDWLADAEFQSASLQQARQAPGLRAEVESRWKAHPPATGMGEALARLRFFKQRQMLRIGLRDLGRLAGVEVLTRELSDVADVCLESVYQVCFQDLASRLGSPYHQAMDGAWKPTSFCVLGLGKLGGRELNYSSDVDLIFVYEEEGFVFKSPPGKGASAPSRGMASHQFFIRLAELMTAEIGRLASEGMLYRVDLRLRPEGATGPLARSLASYENYYAQYGQTWERMMLIKARHVAGQTDLSGEFIEMIQPFRYPRSLEGAPREVAAMKQRIENEVVKSGELDRNVKLGRGGIREIEFLVQTQQLLHAGRIPFLQESHTLRALEKLVQYGKLEPRQAIDLSQAYAFLRDLEHRLQMEAGRQTHVLPTSSSARQRLAALMECKGLAQFEKQLEIHTRRVRKYFEKYFRAAAGSPELRHTLPGEIPGNEAAWQAFLANASFRESGKALRLLDQFIHGPGYFHLSSRTVDLGWDLAARLIALCPKKSQPPSAVENPAHPSFPDLAQPKTLSDPDRVLARLDSFIAAYGARAGLFEMWAANPTLFELILLLFDRSEFLAELAIRVPDMVDELEQSGRLRRSKTAPEILRDLRHGLGDADQLLWLRRYHQTEFMRIGLRDILGLADFEQNLVELTALADACLQYALETSMRRHRLKKPPFAIIGLGKLGGGELTYGSDLDLLFVAPPRVKNLSALQALAAEVMSMLSSQTELGVAFVTDARLRPDGEKGLLVNSLSAYEDYYRRRAMLWEIQTLTRVRPVGGDMELGQSFQQLAARLANFAHPSLPLAAHTPDWKKQIAQMRHRIETQRVPAGQAHLAFKTGAGGLVDAEFIAQTLCLERGWQEPNTWRALTRAQVEGALPPAEAASLLANYQRLRRIEGILRRWSYEGETELPVDPAPLYRVAVRCGYNQAEPFMQDVTACRAAIREVYKRFFEAK